jgi:hypothetical protein
MAMRDTTQENFVVSSLASRTGTGISDRSRFGSVGAEVCASGAVFGGEIDDRRQITLDGELDNGSKAADARRFLPFLEDLSSSRDKTEFE